MIRNYLYSITLALIIVVPAFSQDKPPGYLGKKNTFQIGYSFFPAWLNFTYYRNPLNGDYFPAGRSSFNQRVTATYQHVVGMKSALGAFVSYYKNEYPTVKYYGLPESGGSQPYGYYYTGQENHFSTFVEIGGLINLYSRNEAPLGRYRSIRLSYISTSSTVDLSKYKGPNNISYSDRILEMKSNAMRFSFIFGSNRIIADKLLIDYGLEFGMYVSPIKANGYIFGANKNYDQESQNLVTTLNRRANAAGATNGFILVNLSFGYVW